MFEKNLPLVSIIITSYNRADVISRAIESAIVQDYPNLEIIISDNHSSDHSMNIINRYANDSRIKIFQNPANIGMIPNFKRATIELAQGEFITYVSSDDYLCDSHFVYDAIRLINKYPDVLLVFGKLRQVTMNKETVGETDEKPFWQKEFFPGKEVFLRFTENSWLSWAACMLKRKELIDLKPFDDHNTGKDAEINLKLLLLGNACFINRICYEQVIHFNNASLSSDIDKKIGVAQKCFESAYQFAVSTFPSEKAVFDEWRSKVLETYFKQLLISFKIMNAGEYKVLLRFLKEHYADIYKSINKDPRWKLMNTLYHPLMFPLLRLLSPKRYEYFQKRANTLS